MGLLTKLFGLKTVCPTCEQFGAKDGFFSVRCPNPQCLDYDPAFAEDQRLDEQAGWYEPCEPYYTRRPVRFDATVGVEYINARGLRRSFQADAESIQARGRRWSMRVAPTGYRISLSPDRIVNRAEVETRLGKVGKRAVDFSSSLTILYTNFKGESKSFTAARQTLRCSSGAGSKYGRFYSACIAPKGVRIVLKSEAIGNLDEVHAAWLARGEIRGRPADTKLPYAEDRPAAANFSDAVSIQYTNHLGLSKVFEADPRSLCWRSGRVSARIAPSGIRIRLLPEKIANRDTVERCIDQNLQRLTPDFGNPLLIEYVNYLGESKTFTAQRDSIRHYRNRISVRVAPSGVRISLARDRIQNQESLGL